MPTPNNSTHASHSRRVTAITCAVLSAAAIIMMFCTSAYAGQWIQVSCVNPNQSAAPSQGWTSFTTGNPGYGSNNSTVCGPGEAMSAILSADAPAEVYSGENLQYTPPNGSTLAGGQVDASMDADGGGYDASGTAIAYSPEAAYSGSNVLFQCAHGQTLCADGTNDFTGVLDLPSNKGGSFYIGAGCGGSKGAVCDEGGSYGAWSLVEVWWANFLLANSSTPAANSLGGTLLDPSARGTQELTFDASDPEGPGVYDVTAQIDGQSIYSATPNNNRGQCIPVGESSGVLMFDSSQPCPASESDDLSINTTGLLDGQHTLKLILEDAATNTSVVYDGTITTHNAPQNTTTPTITAPEPVTAASALSANPGAWSAPAGAGSITYAYQWEDCNTEGNNCHALPGAQNPTYTPAPTDAGHTLRLTVTAADNDGATTATTPTTTIPSAAESPVAPLPGQVTSALPGQATGTNTSPPTGTGMPNGTPASETATLHINNPAPTTRNFGQKAFKLTGYFASQALKLTGRLTNSQAQPIANATLDILQQTAGTSTPTLIRDVTTSATGTFTLTLPAGPSRTIEIAYRALSSDTNYAATAEIHESAHATAQLKIGVYKRTPTGRIVISAHTTTPTGEILISGKVNGPTPPQGTIIELLVHYLGHWEPIRVPHTKPNGSFEVEYQFQHAIGRFPFLIQIPAGQPTTPTPTATATPSTSPPNSQGRKLVAAHARFATTPHVRTYRPQLCFIFATIVSGNRSRMSRRYDLILRPQRARERSLLLHRVGRWAQARQGVYRAVQREQGEASLHPGLGCRCAQDVGACWAKPHASRRRCDLGKRRQGRVSTPASAHAGHCRASPHDHGVRRLARSERSGQHRSLAAAALGNRAATPRTIAACLSGLETAAGVNQSATRLAPASQRVCPTDIIG